MVNILKLQDLRQDEVRSEIERCWSDKNTFLILPEKSTYSNDQLKKIVTLIEPQGSFGLFTSGTTSSPKLILGKKEKTAELVYQINDKQGLGEIDLTIVTLPASYSYSLVNQYLWAIKFEKSLLTLSGVQSLVKVCLVESDKNLMLCLVGSQIDFLKMFIEKNQTFENVKVLNFAGGPFPSNQLDFLKKTFPRAKIFNNYGCTEALPRLVINEINDSKDAEYLCGALPGVELRVADDNKLEFRSIYGCHAIVDTSTLEVRSFDATNWIPTGDLAEFESNGKLKLLGRDGAIFKRYGEKISLSEISSLIDQLECFKHVFYIEEENGISNHVLLLDGIFDKKSLRPLLLKIRENFNRSWWPVRIECVDALPLNANGKVDTRKLKTTSQRKILWSQNV